MDTEYFSYSRSEILERIGTMAQLGGTRHYTLNEGKAKGVSAIDCITGSGLRYTVLPDRGMDISLASYKGVPLVYLTPNFEASPHFFEPRGEGWLRTFTAGLLTTCGLTYLGSPGRDGDQELGLHGRHSTLPASSVTDSSRWEGERYLLEVSGRVEESRLYGDKVRMERTIISEYGGKSLQITDKVTNFGFKRSPFTILYHINPGFPLLSEHSRLFFTADHSEPYDEKSRLEMDEMKSFTPPQSGYEEKNYFHRAVGDEQGYAYAALINRQLLSGLGLYVKYEVENLPFLSEWKMLGQGEYVLGIEPCNVQCLNRAELRKENRLPFLEPGESRELRVEIGILDGRAEIDEFINMVQD